MAGAARLYRELGHHAEAQVASHLLASHPHGTYVEAFHPDRDPIWWNLISNRPQLVDGCIDLPSAPGFGWELDQEYIEHHKVSVGPSNLGLRYESLAGAVQHGIKLVT
jgi:D-galactarolactone cycloisomerase